MILAIASAWGGCQAALCSGDSVVAQAGVADERGLAGRISPMLAGLLQSGGAPEAIAVIVGPGSFTGLRAGIASAVGLGLGFAIPVVGVTVGEAIMEALPQLGERVLWIATHSRRGQIFIDIGGALGAYPADGLPPCERPVAVAGNAGNPVAASLAARGVDVMLTSARRPGLRQVAAVGERRVAGQIPGLAALPLYVDPPEARLPVGGLRPVPA